MGPDDARAVVAEFFPKHQAGDRDASPRLVAVMQQELRRLATERVSGAGSPGGSAHMPALYAAAMEAAGVPLEERSSFLLICARAMRATVVDHMRSPAAQEAPHAELVLAIEDLLDAFERFNSRMVRVVEALYFAALPDEQASRALRIEPAVLRRDWKRARAWLLKELPSYDASAGPREVSVTNAAWVDAVFDDALALTAEQRIAFLDRCSAVSPNLRRDVDDLMRLADHALPGFEPGGLGEDALWAILSGVASVPAGEITETAARPEPGEPSTVAPPPSAPPAAHASPLHAGSLETGTEPERAHETENRSVMRRWLGPRGTSPVREDATVRALLRLKHPHVGRVLDAEETEDGRWFLLLERIEGRAIDRYCDEELLTIDERLDLFLQVCSAVQYGHRKLIAHGAIEPSTVLVTSEREVKVVEYGTAALLPPPAWTTDSTEWRPARAYASPEQVQGDPIAVASDVYQLGLLLYELLTGEKAHEVSGLSREALERAVCTETVVRPSARVLESSDKLAAARRLQPRTLARTLRGDLDAIVMYALRKEPDRRYPSVSALRSDIQRYRSRMPIWVRSESALYRVQRFLLRRRLPLAAVLAFVIAGLVLLPDPLRQRLRATQERARVAQVEQLLDGMLGPVEGARGGAVPTTLQFVEEAERVANAELASDPPTRATVLTRVGRAYAALGHYDLAIEALEDALMIRRTSFGDDSLEVAETLEALAVSEHRIGRYDESEASFRNVLAIRQVRAGAAHPSTAGATIGLGDLLHARGQILEAEQVLRAAVARLRPEIRMAGSDAPVNTLLPRALRDLAGVLRDRGLPAEASALYREAITMLKQPGHAGPDLPLTRIEFARLLISRGDLERAEAELAEALPALRRAHHGDHPDLAVGLRAQAWLRMEQGRLDAAGEPLADARRLQEESLGRIHPLVSGTVALQAELARRRNQITEAIATARQALDDYDRLGLQAHPDAIDARLTLGQALIAGGANEEALRTLAAGLAAAERLFVKFDPRIKQLQDAMTRAARAAVPQ